jgi:hypothetical protein
MAPLRVGSDRFAGRRSRMSARRGRLWRQRRRTGRLRTGRFGLLRRLDTRRLDPGRNGRRLHNVVFGTDRRTRQRKSGSAFLCSGHCGRRRGSGSVFPYSGHFGRQHWINRGWLDQVAPLRREAPGGGAPQGRRFRRRTGGERIGAFDRRSFGSRWRGRLGGASVNGGLFRLNWRSRFAFWRPRGRPRDCGLFRRLKPGPRC